ncbi:MAG: orotidine-5'-phosphate decarboxylase [Phycisphaerae bacterium]|nr:orotidine-5'-phosphate decarboxylase [Phycisphaerae bacterium]MDW8262981.1 orotidine-5'-phosphate decarboxylase [Phycisphaerales bacterium]
MPLFCDNLLTAIEQKGAPVCVGIDPLPELFPDELRPSNLNDVEACVDAIYSFCIQLLQALAPLVPVVKFQSACFERYQWEGVEAYYSLIGEARAMGLLTIGDVKRGDIGSTSAAYAEAHLGDAPERDGQEADTPDAITINPFLGLDAIEPFVTTARELEKGLFVLVRTSNPGSAHLQDLKTVDGRTVSEVVADQLAPIAETPALLGARGYSSIGAVVGATQPHTMESLRRRLPRSIFLLPGYGTQGATAEMTRAAFVSGTGAIVSASRSVLYAFRQQPGANWIDAARSAVLTMRKELQAVI